MPRPGWLVGLCLLSGMAQAAAPARAKTQTAKVASGGDRSPQPPGRPDALALKTYQDAFFFSHLRGIGAYLAGYVPKDIPAGAPAHRIELLRTALGYALVTSGFGTVEQSGAGEPRRVELVAYAPKEGPQIADVLSTVGARMFRPGAREPFRAWQVLRLPRPLYGKRAFALLPAGPPLDIDGRAVTTLELIPLTDAELGGLAGRDAARHLRDWAVRNPLPTRSSRWNAILARGRP